MSTLRFPAGPTGPAAGEVVEVRDGDVVAAPQIRAEFDAAALGPPREVPGPIALEQPLGRGFEVDGHRVRWQKWSFHVRVEPKAGVVVGDVAYRDGERSRPVLYEGSLSEMFVPYMDPEIQWAGDAFFDAGDVVRLAEPLDPTVDCPSNAVYLDAVIADDRGRPQAVPRAACLFERYAGDTAWRKRMHEAVEARPRRDLVLRWTAVVLDRDAFAHGPVQLLVGIESGGHGNSFQRLAPRTSSRVFCSRASSSPALGSR